MKNLKTFLNSLKATPDDNPMKGPKALGTIWLNSSTNFNLKPNTYQET